MEVDLYDQIRKGEFQTKLTFPQRPSKPSLIGRHTSKEAKLYVEALEEYEAAMVKYNEDMKAYRKDQQRLDLEFKRAAFKYCDIDQHEKRHRAWEMAWEHGHSSGLGDVLQFLDELSELLI